MHSYTIENYFLSCLMCPFALKCKESNKEMERNKVIIKKKERWHLQLIEKTGTNVTGRRQGPGSAVSQLPAAIMTELPLIDGLRPQDLRSTSADEAPVKRPSPHNVELSCASIPSSMIHERRSSHLTWPDPQHRPSGRT